MRIWTQLRIYIDVDARMCIYWNPRAEGSRSCSVPQLMRIIWAGPLAQGIFCTRRTMQRFTALWVSLKRCTMRCHFWTQGSRKLRESARADNAPALTHTPSAERDTVGYRGIHCTGIHWTGIHHRGIQCTSILWDANSALERERVSHPQACWSAITDNWQLHWDQLVPKLRSVPIFDFGVIVQHEFRKLIWACCIGCVCVIFTEFHFWWHVEGDIFGTPSFLNISTWQHKIGR